MEYCCVGDDAEALEAGACVGDFDGECEGDWAKIKFTHLKSCDSEQYFASRPSIWDLRSDILKF